VETAVYVIETVFKIKINVELSVFGNFVITIIVVGLRDWYTALARLSSSSSIAAASLADGQCVVINHQ